MFKSLHLFLLELLSKFEFRFVTKLKDASIDDVVEMYVKKDKE